MTAAALLEIHDLKVVFPVRNVWGRAVGSVAAVRGVDLVVRRGQTVGLVGESGCGKSTLARAIVRLVPIAAGRIAVAGEDWTAMRERDLRPRRARVQMVFQDPYGSLNPRMRVGSVVAEPLLIHRRGTAAERAHRVDSLLDQVGLQPEDARRFPHEFSGGQRQRIGIARALVLVPELLIADEAVSALDVSIQAQILNLLLDLKETHGHAMLFISHDLRVVEAIADRVVVMYLGRIVEIGTPERIFSAPRHPYTAALARAVPPARPGARREHAPLVGEPPSPLHPPSGCAFRGRCARAVGVCAEIDPPLAVAADGHAVACHRPIEAQA